MRLISFLFFDLALKTYVFQVLALFSINIYTRVSQIAGVFQKMIFESCTLYHIMPFAKIIGPVEKKVTKS